MDGIKSWHSVGPPYHVFDVVLTYRMTSNSSLPCLICKLVFQGGFPGVLELVAYGQPVKILYSFPMHKRIG